MAYSFLDEPIDINILWGRAQNIQSEIDALVPDWYAYTYDGNRFRMEDIAYGGSVFYPLYFHGNEVRCCL